jgi:LysM repeat protein
LVWARDRLAAGFTVVGERIDPEIVLVVTPLAPGRAAGAGEGPGAALAIESAYRAQAQMQEATPLPPSDASAAAGGTGAASEAVVIELPTATATEAATATPEATATATPAPTVTPEPTATPNLTPVMVSYEVRRGDTLVSIAARYAVDVEELMDANDIGARDVFVIQPGQVLIIPVLATPTPELPTPTPEPVATAGASPTPQPRATATSAATRAPGGMRLDAPVLLDPADGAQLRCDEPSTLRWQRVAFVRDSDRYVLHLGFVSGSSAGGEEQIVWILAQSRPVTTTEWELDEGLCGLAPAQSDHLWRWWIEVVEDRDGTAVQVSPPSATWGFSWE